MRRISLIAVALAALSTVARTQAASRHPWDFSASVTGYYIPHGTSYLQPALTADHDGLHLEARYNYEELNSASAWIGIDASGGKAVHVEFTAMAGGVFGELSGIAPGMEITVTAWRLAFYGESEYVFDLGASSGNFFYAWSQFTFDITKAWSAGLAFQRTRIVQTGLDLDRGVTVNWQPRNFGIQASAFDIFDANSFYTLALTLDF